MVLPVVAYGHPTLRKVAKEIEKDYPGLDELLSNMWETMYLSQGVGLAAPQVNKSIRLFMVDASPFKEDNPELEGFKKIFINPVIINESGEEWSFNEGCLSVPEIREDVMRKPNIRIKYIDEKFELNNEFFEGISARIIQHEYDHLEGVMFVDRVAAIRKMLLRKKLNDISKGNIDVNYKMIFPNKKKGRK
ncbi:MAG: peptide deformylase [Bacteroidales bacterium]|nr:peptide deformylase [Bacteroidales bacterium]